MRVGGFTAIIEELLFVTPQEGSVVCGQLAIVLASVRKHNRPSKVRNFDKYSLRTAERAWVEEGETDQLNMFSVVNRSGCSQWYNHLPVHW